MLITLNRLVLLIITSSIIISCNGQGKPLPKVTSSSPMSIGEIVTELDNQIWKIFQDSKDNYWFGSNGEGVYHYDGKTLRQITTADGLVNNSIRGFQEDKHGNIYIETPDGISKFDGETFTTLGVSESTNNQWKLDDNDLWFGYFSNDLYRYDGDSLIVLTLPRQDLDKAFGIEDFVSKNYSPYDVYGIDKDNEGNMWFGTESAGAYRYDGQSFLWFGEKELSTLLDGRVLAVRSILEDKDRYFWLSNFYSKYKINPEISKGYEKRKAVDLYEEVVGDKLLYFNSGLSDVEGNLWMTTYGGSVWKI